MQLIFVTPIVNNVAQPQILLAVGSIFEVKVYPPNTQITFVDGGSLIVKEDLSAIQTAAG